MIEFDFLTLYYTTRGEKAVYANFAIFTGKHLYWNLPLINLKAFRRPVTLSKKDSNTGNPVNIAKLTSANGCFCTSDHE